MSVLYSSVLAADSQYSDLVDCSTLYGVTKLRVTVDRGSARVYCGASPDALATLQDCPVGVTDVRLPMLPYVSVARLSGNSSAIKVEVLGPGASELPLTSEYSVSGVGKMALLRPDPEIPGWKGAHKRNPFFSSLCPAGTSAMSVAASSGATVTPSVDTSVLFMGRPTTKLVVTGSPSGVNMEVGIPGATHPLPADAVPYNQQSLVVAVRSAASAVNAVGLFVGDASYANFDRFNATRSADLGDGWALFTIPINAASGAIVGPVGTGAPTSGNIRSKVNFGTGGPLFTAGEYWLGGAWVTGQQRPRVVLTFDDGYAEWTSYLAPALAERRLPATFGIDRGYVDQTGYITTAQISALLNHSSKLFDLCNHGANNQSYVGVGLANYLANIDYCDAFLSGLGVPEKTRKLHAYVQGSYDSTLRDALVARGFRSARAVGASNRAVYPLLTAYDATGVSTRVAEMGMYALPASCNLGNTQNVGTVTGYINNAKAVGQTFFLMGHEFKATAASSQTYIAGYDAAGSAGYGMSNLLDWIANERDAGRLDVVSWSDWVDLVNTGFA